MRCSSAVIRLFKRDMDWGEAWGRVMIRCGSKFDGETLVLELMQDWEMPEALRAKCQAWARDAGLPLVVGEVHQHHDEVRALSEVLLRRATPLEAVERISRGAASKERNIPQGDAGPVCPNCLEEGEGEVLLTPSWAFVDVPIEEFHVRPSTVRRRWGVDVAFRRLDLTSGALVAVCPCCGDEFWVEVERFESSQGVA